MNAISLIEGFPVNGLSAIHPGEFLREVMDDLTLTQAAIAQAIGVSPMRVSLLLKGQRPITAELALRLGRALRQIRTTGRTCKRRLT